MITARVLMRKTVDGTKYRLEEISDTLGDQKYFDVVKNLWSNTSWMTLKTFGSNNYEDAVKFFKSIK